MSNGQTRIFAGAGAALARDGVLLRGGLFRCTADDGRWDALSNGLPDNAEVHAILVHPDNPDIIFAGTQDGPYRSDDGGDSWRRLGFPDRGAMIWSLTIHPTRPNVMYAGAAPIALYRSVDSGETWHRLPNAVSPAHCERAGFDSRVLRITVDPNRPGDIYAALEVSGVLRSTDGGDTWSDMSAPLIKLAEQPHLHSNVGGRHCGHLEGILDSHATAVSSAAPDTVFLGLRMGLFRSDDLAQTWRRIDHGIKAESTLMAVALNPRDSAQVYSVTRTGQVFGTQDAGDSWREYRLPSGVEDVYAVACACARYALVVFRAASASSSSLMRVAANSVRS